MPTADSQRRAQRRCDRALRLANLRFSFAEVALFDAAGACDDESIHDVLRRAPRDARRAYTRARDHALAQRALAKARAA